MPHISRRSLLGTCAVSGAAAVTAGLAKLCCAQAQTATPSSGVHNAASSLSIPAAHPRLWWTSERLERARSWYKSNPFTPDRDDYAGQAFVHLVTGDKRYARQAIDWAVRFTITDRAAIDPNNGVASNGARWYGEHAILVYDWCWDQMTPDERQTIIQRWNVYLENLKHKEWGGVRMPQSNYFWGYLRNEFEWGVATWGENALAETFLNHSLQDRWQDSFVPQAATTGRGGVAQEGSQYGRYLLGYSVVPLYTATTLGRKMFDETEFFKSAVYYVIYTTLPAATATASGGPRRFEVFPACDDQFFKNGGSAESIDYGNFMANSANTWRNIPTGEYARRWLSLTKARVSDFIAAADEGGIERDFDELPLDYFAPGPQYLSARTSWRPEATVLHLQLGSPAGGGHAHDDAGNWQMWRRGRWLSRETTGYGDTIADYANRGQTTTSKTVGHNGLLLNGKGLADGERNGRPVLRRLESRRDYVHAVVDLSLSYRNDKVSHRRERDNPVAGAVEREFVFLRPLETLVIFDRVGANGAVMPAHTVTKTFLAHFEQAPTIEDGRNVIAISGDEALRLTTMLPENPEYRVVKEGGPIDQHRLEIETSGTATSYFLHVLQARDKNGQNVNAILEDTPATYVLTLRHLELGSVRIEFAKNAGAAGGGIRFSRESRPDTVVPFLDRIQEMRVTDSGPVWETLPGDEAIATMQTRKSLTRQTRPIRRSARR